MHAEETTILGAGLAGLSCAHHLGSGYQIFERDEAPGGVARSYQRDGFSFDVTGHWLHLRDPDITRLALELLPDGWLEVQRIAEIHTKGVRTPYPFQANTFGHRPEVIADCLIGYLRAREASARGDNAPARSFEDFIRQRMGDGIAEHFMLPYNTKLWTVPPAQMDHAWCERFVPIPDPETVIRGALQPADRSALGYNATFRYPKSGGIGQFAAALAKSLKGPLHLNRRASRIDWRAREIEFDDGSRHPYRTLVSTIPLNAMVEALVQPPAQVIEAAGRLRATSVTYWDLGFAGANPPGDAHWIYCPDSDVPFYRVGAPSAAVATLAPAGHRSYYVEVSHAQGTTCQVDDDQILQGLRQVGLLDDDSQPVVLNRSTVECAYVIMDRDYGASRSLLLDWLADQGIESIGRYGAWMYDSMEGAVLQGRAAASRIRELAE